MKWGSWVPRRVQAKLGVMTPGRPRMKGGAVYPGGSRLRWGLCPQEGPGRGQAAPSSGPETHGGEEVRVEPSSLGTLAVSSAAGGDPAPRAGQEVGGLA